MSDPIERAAKKVCRFFNKRTTYLNIMKKLHPNVPDQDLLLDYNDNAADKDLVIKFALIEKYQAPN